MQTLALTVSAVFILLLTIAFFIVVSRAGEKAAFEKIAPGGYRLRNTLFKVLVVGGVVVAGLSLPRAFISTDAWAASDKVQTIHAIGYQWYWELDADEATVGLPVEFLVSSADVTHGFGIYDENMTLIAQTQAMPGYTNRLNVTFDKPGVYQLLCLEFCGVAHHDMVAEITVSVASTEHATKEGASE